MSTICLVRHGETDWNVIGRLQGRTDISLNQKGIKQSEESREFLADSNWDVLITSPLRRTKKTAEIINTSLNIPIFEMGAFVEKSHGDAEGMTKEEKLEKFPDGIVPNEESMHDLKHRVMKGIHKISEKFPNKKVLLVTHGGVIHSILSTLSDGSIGSGKTKLINACISNIYFHDNGWKVKDYNQVTHLSQYNNIVK